MWSTGSRATTRRGYIPPYVFQPVGKDEKYGGRISFLGRPDQILTLSPVSSLASLLLVFGNPHLVVLVTRTYPVRFLYVQIHVRAHCRFVVVP